MSTLSGTVVTEADEKSGLSMVVLESKEQVLDEP
jgi:hypothetical protein